MKATKASWFGLVILIGVVVTASYLKWRRNSSLETNIDNHAQQLDMSRMRALYQQIEFFAITDPVRFVKGVGEGLTTDATHLPDHIGSEQLFPTNEIPLYWDQWGRPFNVSMKPTLDSRSDSTNYDVLVWSNGPNGLNDGRNGDDIFLKWRQVELP